MAIDILAALAECMHTPTGDPQLDVSISSARTTSRVAPAACSEYHDVIEDGIPVGMTEA